jgi:hypothetical protein
VGRPIDIDGAERWLAARMNEGHSVGEAWLQGAAATLGGGVAERPGGGLLPDIAVLDGSGFKAADLRPQLRDFYEHTSAWRMEVWTQRSAIFQPGGKIISRAFGRRVEQLALTTRPLDVALGMDSRVVSILDADGE